VNCGYTHLEGGNVFETGVKMARDKSQIVLDLLAQKKAMPLVEIMSIVDIPDNEVQMIVAKLEKDNLIKVEAKGTLDEIVAIRQQGIRAAG
jgi:predicted transcriptional regulator